MLISMVSHVHSDVMIMLVGGCAVVGARRRGREEHEAKT